VFCIVILLQGPTARIEKRFCGFFSCHRAKLEKPAFTAEIVGSLFEGRSSPEQIVPATGLRVPIRCFSFVDALASRQIDISTAVAGAPHLVEAAPSCDHPSHETFPGNPVRWHSSEPAVNLVLHSRL
jgi:hypothetical protein